MKLPEGGRLLKTLRFERPDRVTAVAGATEDYAREFAGGKSGRDTLVRGSAFTLSASLWCLVEPKRAGKCFEEAAREYGRLGSPLAVPLSVCAAPRKPKRPPPSFRHEDEGVAPQVQPENQLLEWMWVGERLGSLVDDLAPRAEIPTGRFGLPLGLYLDFARSLEGDQPQDAPRLPTGAASYLQRVGELTKVAMSDAYHWNRFHTGLLPIEPEPLAMCLMLVRAMGKQLHFDPDAVEYVPLQVALRLLGPGNEWRD